MLNTQNLTPIRSHERAVALGRKGGSVKSPRKQWINIKYCTQRCSFYGMCPFMSASTTSPEKLCALKAHKVASVGKTVSVRPEIIESFFSLFDRGKEGLLREALAGIFNIRLHGSNASVSELHDYVHTLIDLKKAFYPESLEDQTNTKINTNFQEPEWIIRMEDERRRKELKKKDGHAIDSTAID